MHPLLRGVPALVLVVLTFATGWRQRQHGRWDASPAHRAFRRHRGRPEQLLPWGWVAADPPDDPGDYAGPETVTEPRPTRGARARVGAMLTAAASFAVLSGCAASLPDRAHAQLQERLDSVHESVLHNRALNPGTSGQQALDLLRDDWLAAETNADGDVLSLVLPISVRLEDGGGLSYDSYSLGACVGVLVSTHGGGEDRGRVHTEPITCPPGAEVTVDGYAVNEVTTELEAREDDVSEPPDVPPVCYSGSDCSAGGG